MARRDGSPVWIGPDGDLMRPLVRADLQRRGEKGYDEAWLQDLLHRHPDLFPLSQIDGGLGRAVSACRELLLSFGAGRSGALDNLFVTTTGALVIIETKLWRNPEARRAVVAQALEYASAIFRMSVEDLERGVSRARAAAGEDGSQSLYALAAHAGTELDEVQFTDQLSRNLRRGRAVIAVVGDGIREDIQPLAELLQGHAGDRFTFALIELGVFEAPGESGRIVLPSILAQTTMIERGVVSIQEAIGPARIVVDAASGAATPSIPSGRRGIGIGEDEFLELLGQRDPTAPALLQSFLRRAEALGIRADRQSGLNLKHAAQAGNDLNLGTLSKDGWLDTEPASWFGRGEIGRAYNGRLATMLGGFVQERNELSAVRNSQGKRPRLTEMLPAHETAWLSAMEEYIRAAFANGG